MAISARIDELRKKFDENPRRYFAPLANEYRKAGDLDQAIFICQEYLPLQPGHMSGHIVYGQALFDLARNEEAKAVFETALSLDPENLIALRHLGDIARKSGDTDSARIWYQRVLEADPRNEEIAQIMISLLAEPATGDGAQAEAPTATPTSTPSIAETPRSSRAVPVADSPPGSILDVEQSQDASPLTVPAEPPPIPPAAARSGHELLDIEDFSIGGAQTSAAASTAPAKEAPAEAEPASAPEIDSDKTGVFELGKEDGPFEPDPYAIAASPEPRQAPTPVAGVTPVHVDAVREETPPADEMTKPDPVVDGLETFEAGVIAVPPDVVVPESGLETESFFDLDGTPPSAAPAIAAPSFESASAHDAAPTEDGLTDTTEEMDASVATPVAAMAAQESHTPELAAEPEAAAEADAPVEAFVTETMAELYLQQGHVDSALEIYRRLVELRPHEPPLQERLRALEEYGNAKAPEPVVEEPPIEYAGPTIREFLIGLTMRRVDEPRQTDGDAEPVQESWSEPPQESWSEPAEEPAVEPVAESIAEPSAGVAPEPEPEKHNTPRMSNLRLTPAYAAETVSGSIDALFGGADASAADATAAATLAEAFASEPPADEPELRGVPAHLASQELSLDHVFKSRTPPRPAGDGFSFDQFFAGDANETASGAPGDTHGAAPAEGADDVAQFNAWLNGLKKT